METSKYLRYAVGEVILVVIGILIALQVNNFNEAKKYKKEQKEFLKGLKDELILDTIKISEQERIFKGFQESVLNGKDLLSKTSHSNEEKKIFINAIHDLLKLTPINKNVNRHDIKISEGIISNIEIKNLLIKYFEVTKYDSNKRPLELEQFDYGIKYFMNPTSMYTNEKINEFGSTMPVIIGNATKAESDMDILINQGYKVWQQ